MSVLDIQGVQTVHELTAFGEKSETEAIANLLASMFEVLERQPPEAAEPIDDSEKGRSKTASINKAVARQTLAREALARLIVNGQLPFIKEGDVVHSAAEDVHFHSRRISTLF